MQQHEENINKVIDETKEKLAKNIGEAEHRKQMPNEAVIVTITNSIVFWGNPLERKRFKKKWVKQQAESMSGQMKYNLEKIGTVCSIRPIDGGKGEIWNIWDTADVHMTKEAEARLEAKAPESVLKEYDENKKQADELDKET